jgi:hypothetical protein
MEAAIRDRLMNIEVTAAAERGSTPLALDRKLFQSVFGVVTWHALYKVVDHCQTTQYPLKPCTGSFTQATGLPCAHVCDTKRSLGGLVIEDFDEHWFWDRSNIHRPLREPQQIRITTQQQNLPQASTGRILSSFETVQPGRTLPMCSACHQRGHTRSSRHCPVRIRAEIAEGHQALREDELQQASQSSNRLLSQFRATAVSPTSSAESFHTAASFADVLRTMLIRISANQSENGSINPKTPNEVYHRTSISPQHMFRMPLSTNSTGFCIPSSQDLDLTPSCIPNLLLVFIPSPQRLPISPLAALPLSPLPRNCP